MQCKGLALGEPPYGSWYLLSQVSMPDGAGRNDYVLGLPAGPRLLSRAKPGSLRESRTPVLNRLRRRRK